MSQFTGTPEFEASDNLICNEPEGLVVPMPTLPPVVTIDPIVFEFPIAANLPVILATPAVIFVSIILVVVTFNATTVPAMFRLPDTLMLPPVIVVADNKDVFTVLNEPLLTVRLPAVTFAHTALVADKFVVLIIPELILVVASKVEVVSPLTRALPRTSKL